MTKRSRDINKTIWTIALVCLFYAMSINTGYAGLSALCTFVNPNGNIITAMLKAVATLGVIAVGISATLGKISVPMAITVAVGISIIFGANTIAGFFGLQCP